jgi:transposase-like protein
VFWGLEVTVLLGYGLHKLRCAMVRPGRDRLGGAVEVDETYIGGSKPGKRGRGAAGKVLVLVAAQEDEKRIGRIRLRRIADASANSLEEAVPEMVVPGSIVRTDDWSGYRCLVKHGYTHDVVRKDASIGENLLPLANECNTTYSMYESEVHSPITKLVTY